MRNSNSYLDTINKSRPVIFNYKNRNKNGMSFLYGLITQEVTQIIPYNPSLWDRSLHESIYHTE